MKKISIIILILIFNSFLLLSQTPPKAGVGIRISGFGILNSIVDRFAIEHQRLPEHRIVLK